MSGPELKITGVTFETLRCAITDLYFRHKGMTQEQFDAAKEFVIPMQHNFMNPIEPGTQDTWIQYWINNDERLTHDYNRGNWNMTMKVAHCTIRFLGVRAELWAKAFHHLTRHQYCANIFKAYCQAMILPAISPIVPINVDYFKVGNTTKAFGLTFKLQYDEVLDFTLGSGGDRLEYISFAAGQIVNEQSVEGGIE